MTGYQTGTGNQLTNDGLWTYTYDSEGNLIKKSKGTSLETWQFGYDNLNHLVWAKDEPTDGGSPTLIATYIYDVFGNRIEKDVWTQQSGQTAVNRFGYDGTDIWANLSSSNALQTRYVRDGELDDLIARIGASGIAAWYLHDKLDSVRNLTDNTGTLLDTLAYDAYGNLKSESQPSNGDDFKWEEGVLDSEIGDYHFGWREFDPPSGRWLSQDQSGFSAGDNNLYRFVENGPTNANDPTGLVLQIDGKPITPKQLAAAQPVFKNTHDNSVVQETIERMKQATHVYNFKTEDLLRAELTVRVGIVNSVYAFANIPAFASSSGPHPSNLAKPNPYWVNIPFRTRWYVCLRSGSYTGNGMMEAINYLFENGKGNLKCDCAGFAFICMWHGVVNDEEIKRKYLDNFFKRWKKTAVFDPEKRYNRFFISNFAFMANYPSDAYFRVHDPAPKDLNDMKDPILPGDRVRFEIPNPKKPLELTGESVIYLSNGMVYGFGLNEPPMSWNQMVFNLENESQNKPPARTKPWVDVVQGVDFSGASKPFMFRNN